MKPIKNEESDIFDELINKFKKFGFNDVKEKKMILHSILSRKLNVTDLCYLAENGVDVNSQNKKSLFHSLCQKNFSFESINRFIDLGGDMNRADSKKMSPFYYALENKNLTEEILELMIEKKADLNQKSKFGYNSLQHLLTNHLVTLNMVQTLLKNGAQVNNESVHQTAATTATKKHVNLEIFKLILENKANLNEATNIKPIISLCQKKTLQIEKLKMLIKYKADVNACIDNASVLHLLLKNSQTNFEIVKLIFENDFREVERRYEGCSLLHFASKFDIKDHEEIIKYLIEKKCRNISDYNSNDYFHYLLQKKDVRLDFIKYLVDNKYVDIKNHPNQNITYFHSACLTKDVKLDTLKYFLEMKFDPNNQGNRRRFTERNTVFHFACKTIDNLDTLKFLIENKASVNQRNISSLNSLSFALTQKTLNFAKIKFLLENNANVDCSISTLSYLIARKNCEESDKIFDYLLSEHKTQVKLGPILLDLIKFFHYINFERLERIKNSKTIAFKNFIPQITRAISFHDNVNLRLLKFLSEIGCSFDLLDHSILKSLLYHQLNCNKRNNKSLFEILQFFVEKKADVGPLLAISVPLRSLEICRLFVENKALINTLQGNKTTPIYTCCELNLDKQVLLLLTHKADPNLSEMPNPNLGILDISNRICKKLIIDSFRNNLWTKDRHSFFPVDVKEKVFSLFSSLKFFPKKISFKIPKPIILMIVTQFLISLYQK